MYQSRIRLLFRLLWPQFIWLTLILLGARYVMFQQFTGPSALVDQADDIRRMWITGLRYDLRIAGMALAPLVLSGLLLAAWRSSWQLWRHLALGFIALVSLIVAGCAISNFYYYQTYHRHFDVFAFGLFEDDTSAVLANMGQDYPILAASLLAVLLAAIPTLFAYYQLRTASIKGAISWPFFIIYVLISLTLVFAFARGSLGTFPLRRGNAQVSELSVLNQLTPNALMALAWARKDKIHDVKFSPVSSAEGQALLTTLNFDSLNGQTPRNDYVSQYPPHVVVAMMEGLGSNMLAFDEPERNDLLGRLRPHFEQDFLFTRFLSQDNGTAPSLAALFFNSPVQSISHSSAQTVDLTTPFDVYKKAGYRNIFISPGNMMWRNLVNYLPLQGVDAVYDQNALLEHYPDAEQYMTDWGLPDEYAYRLAEKLLAESEQPLFISILSVTNHPPYVTPNTYTPKPVAITPHYQRHIEEGAIKPHNILTTFQYASDALGGFISHIKDSDLAKRTLIAVTGDHQMRRVKAFYPNEQVLDRGVPFYLYVPDNILNTRDWHFDPTRVGSHKDIMPTLYHYSLSQQPYLALGGRNMLATTDDAARNFGYNVLLWIDAKGAYVLNESPVFYPWLNTDSLQLDGEQAYAVSPQQDKRMAAYPKLLRWHINQQVKGEHTSEKQ
ncbi:LTA synthase family protein [Oceanisphaera pacifica]|uniref:LTA synthase family protein n=1 Tax=Oceanisphaera pacifica TaxID=2818389 RepID=A0ABS3NH54_9GAMM|nr:LTA synthase family protein [Oceanisphaera pacifica]MBO1519897.1 LTA synthase family protein [Oceanisphaera pacifica]